MSNPKSYRRSRAFVEVSMLEARRLFAAVYPTNVEQYELELINRARANPTVEASRMGIALNEGLPANTISTAAKQPLAINLNVTDAARKHSDWMLANDVFAHNESNGSDPGDRMRSAGYSFTGSWTWGENIAYRSSSRPNTPEPVSTAAQVHADLFIDSGISGRGHRTNMMSNAFKEIGVGIDPGEFNNYNALMVTTDFATSGTGSFLTGVAYSDVVTHDSFYTPGEGLDGIVITATRSSDNSTFTTTSWSSGGYSLKLLPGTYSVKATGGALGVNGVGYSNVVIGNENVKRDFTPDSGLPVVGTASLRGTVYLDANQNGQVDTGESGVSNVLVYIEKNHDNRRNANEKYARTNADGAYKFSGLAAGTIRIQQALIAGMMVTAPVGNTYVVTLKPGQAVGGRSFANVGVSNPVPLSLRSAATSFDAFADDAASDDLIELSL